jgi:hypothetical protein
MPIDITTDPPITFAQAAALVPRRRRGRKASVSTLYRWAKPPGTRGIVLETIQVGGTLCTSVGALQRFFDLLTAARSGAGVPADALHSDEKRAKAADADLDRRWGRAASSRSTSGLCP